jgi:hypothetical protein
LNQVSGAPFNCQAIPSSPSGKPRQSISVLIGQSLLRYAAMSDPAHRNVAVVAFANKLARIAWAVLRRRERFADKRRRWPR